MDKPADLKNLGVAAAPTPIQSDEDVAREMLEKLEKTIVAMHLELRSLKGRITTMETFVAYLLEKDPQVGEKMKAMADAANAVEGNSEKKV